MEKRVALLRDGVVFNIVVAYSAEEMATLFDCEAVEVTDQTEQAHIGYGFIDGVFEQAPSQQPPVVEAQPVEESLVEEGQQVEENL